jgi:hypothetical protein
MSATLVSVIITPNIVNTAVPAGITPGALSAVVTDSTGAAQPAQQLTSAPYALTTSLPISADGVTVAASVVYTSLDSNGNPISAPGNPSASIALTLTEPSFPLATGATMVLTPASATANPAVAAAAKKAR